jgi:nicotinamide-nucleotide amidase
MKAEIISVGTELLLGEIIDTNAAFISRNLAELGIGVYRRVTVGDNMERLAGAMKAAFENADLVIASGGLGPTADDITQEAGARCFGLELVLDDNLLEWLKDHFASRGYVMTENNIKQAYMPVGALPLANKNGTAPGVLIENDGKLLALLPGPPAEAEPMFINELRPILEKRREAVLVSKTLKLCGIGESSMEHIIRDMMDGENPTVAPYASYSQCRLRVTARAKETSEARAMIEPVKTELYRRLGDYIYGEDSETLEGVIIKLLTEKGLTVACAESCTGGMVSARLTGVPGASAALLEGAVTYSNGAKINRLGVSGDTLDKHGAVSAETAMEMARGIAAASGADIGISITGIAGPGGGSAEKPVGLVYFGLCAGGKTTFLETRTGGDRERIRTRAAVKALEILWRFLTDRGIKQ